MLYRFMILSGERKGQQITVPEEPMTIGRGPDCGLSFNDPEIATSHAVVEHGGQGLVIRDLNSMGKVLVNNRGVREARLKHGDIIELGRTRMLLQAVVEADVRDPRARRHRRRKAWRVAVVVMLLVGGLGTYFAKRVQEELAKGMAPRHAQARPPVAMPELPPPEELPAETNLGPEAVVDAAPAVVERDVPDALATNSVVATPSPVLVGTPPEPVAPPGPDPYVLAQAMVDARVRGMMADASLLIASNRLQEADEVLRGVQRLDPDYLQAYADRAWLLEDRGMLDPALAQWREIVRRGGNAELEKVASSKITKLEQAHEQAAPKFSGRVRVMASDQRKFPETGGVSEMRVVTLRLQSLDQGQALDPRAVNVEVLFFDRDRVSGSVRRSRATVNPAGLNMSGTWQAGEVKTLTATYAVPVSMAPGGERPEVFYGYLVRVYHYGALQDEKSQPPALLQMLAADHQPGPPNNPIDQSLSRRRP